MIMRINKLLILKGLTLGMYVSIIVSRLTIYSAYILRRTKAGVVWIGKMILALR